MMAAFAQLPALLAAHVLISAAALALALLIALPLAVAAVRRPRLRAVALGFVNLVQTIPGLALLALFYPLLLALSAVLGADIPALGFLPSLLALALYALLPILRNAIAGLAGIDPAVIEAANGIGMTARQRLRLVEIPLAAPVAMAGIRTAAVWTIGTATLATTVGQPSLGNLIFSGLQTEAIDQVVVGCVAAAALALCVDALLGMVERGIIRRRRRPVMIALVVLLAGVLACLAPLLAPQRQTIVVGAKNFSEQFILARLIGDRLTEAGYAVEYREGLGSAVVFRALSAGEIDVYVEYSGTIWTALMRRADNPGRRAMEKNVAGWLAQGPRAGMVGPLGFENAYALAMREKDARRLGITSLADLAGVAPRLQLGGDLEFFGRPEWAAVRDGYGLRFAGQRAYSPTFMYRALASGRADVISAFSSDGRIAADRLRVLSDPKGVLPAYDALLLVSPRRMADGRFLATLRPLVGSISVEMMRAANFSVDRDRDKYSPDDAAKQLARRIGR